MGKSTGFLEYDRQVGKEIPVFERIKNFHEFHTCLSLEEQRLQGARCMDCGIPFCQSGAMIGGMASGCPLHNLVPEINDLVYHGNFEQAYVRLTSTNCFPEFTSRVCPALCEAACTCGLHGEPVATKENEKAVIEYAFEKGLVHSEKPRVRTGKKVAVIGSGPAGLACAMKLNKRGHLVTVYERNDKAGGLLRYGIPNMKLEKSVIDRRIRFMEESGIQFVYNTDVGRKLTGKELLEQYDRVVLACGASHPRDIQAPGREAEGIWFAVDFLSQVTKKMSDNNFSKPPYEMAKNKHVIVIGGGDTGNDCVGTVLRLGAKSVVQLELLPAPPDVRQKSNPWPEWAKVKRTDYGQEEAAVVYGCDPRRYQTTVQEFIKDQEGHVKAVRTVRMVREAAAMVSQAGTEEELPADLVLIAAGFLGSEAYVADTFDVAFDERSNVKTEKGSFATAVERVFTAGDMHRGQSLVVWAIAEGRAAAKAVDESLMGYTNL